MTNRIQYESLEDVYKDVHGIVEANSYESLTLWQYWHQQKGYTWVQNNSGWLECVGKIADKEVWISPLAHIVNGRKILFVDATSTLVDWDMIEKYLEQNVPSACTRNGKHLMNKENAQNFHCLIH